MTTGQRNREAPPGHRMIQGVKFLTEVFDVTHGGQVIGNVKMHREGLYCRVSCRCRRFDDEMIDLLERLQWWNRPIEEVDTLIPILSNPDIAQAKIDIAEYLRIQYD